MRRLLFFSDHHADPLWELPSEVMVDLDSLPISDELRDTVRAWAREWDEGTGDETAGRELWCRMRTELGGGWSIGWAVLPAGGERHAQWDPDGPLEPCPPQPENGA